MDPIVVLDAAMTLAAARKVLSDLAIQAEIIALRQRLTGAEPSPDRPSARLIIRRPHPRVTDDVLWYSLTDADRDRVMDGRLDPAMPLGVSLDLHEHGADDVRQLDDPDVTDGTWCGLVLDGTRPVGWMPGDAWSDRGPSRGGAADAPQQADDRGPTRSIDFGTDDFDVDSHVTPVGEAPAPVGPPQTACMMCAMPAMPRPGADPVEERFGELGAKPEPPAAPAAPPAVGSAEMDPDLAGPLGGPAETPARPAAAVQAFPRVDVPEKVAPAAAFEVVVGVSQQAQPGVQGAVMTVMLPVDHPTTQLTLQIKAENFTVAEVRQELEFDPKNVGAHTATFHLTAPAVTQEWQGRIEVEYGHNGLLIGTAWRELLVTPDAPAQAPASTSGGEVAVNLDQRVPIDLTVSISRGEAAGTFLWTFTTPHPVTLPDEQVITQLERDTAETFALSKVREMAKVDGSPTAELKVAGVATEVAGVMPLSFWDVLAQVWRVAKDDGRLPTVLLVSQESLVPWELASTDEDFIVDRTLVDEAAPQILGAQAIVGRWRPAGPAAPSGVQRPRTTPTEAIAIKSLAVVVGEFGASSGMKSLKEAKEEGEQLTATYPSIWIQATDQDVASLLKGTRRTDRGVPVDAQVLHVASHGEVDPQSPINSGVILSNSSVRIDEAIVIGSKFTKDAKPFVFLNCCQLATETGGALVEGGLAAAFLRAGASAFVAPLWYVNDGIAKQTALTFYAETIGKGRPVGDVMRQLRARFTTENPKRDQTTPLAYAYYGHPGLILTRQETH